MSEDDPIGKRQFEKNRDPFAFMDQMKDLGDLAQSMTNRIKLTIDLTPDEGVAVLNLLKEIRK